ncbi:MAG: DUF1810 domain-containing protein [Nocardioidaceae bacterium]|nr:DUF1810 domain-containing protein [Nocardioidaceae bacterium]
MMDAWDLERFVTAQGDDDSFGDVLAELRAGHKTSHWMWFVFPQLDGLGHSAMSRRFAISSIQEARAYLQHPVLGERLTTCAAIVASAQAQTAEQIFGHVDAKKLHSSMTLFLRAAPEQPIFGEVLDRFYAGQPDPATDQLLPG